MAVCSTFSQNEQSSFTRFACAAARTRTCGRYHMNRGKEFPAAKKQVHADSVFNGLQAPVSLLLSQFTTPSPDLVHTIFWLII